MSQHFLLTPQARQLSMIRIAQMSETEARQWFAKLRWPDTNGEPVCPKCGCLDHWELPSTGRWKCKGCYKQFSLTSDTLFSSYKKPLRVYLFALAEFANAAKSMAALELCRIVQIHYRTAWLWLQKFRSALFEYRDESLMDGVVEMDGCYTNHTTRPANRKVDRVVDRQRPQKRCILTLRQRDPIHPGACRTLTFITHHENSETISYVATRHIAPGSEIQTDENRSFGPLYAHFNLKQVNHQECYVGPNGENNNQCESYNSRFKRMRYGVLHRMGVLYLDLYANEVAYREDTRRWSNHAIFHDMVMKCLQTPVNNELLNYCRGNGRVQERLA